MTFRLYLIYPRYPNIAITFHFDVMVGPKLMLNGVESLQ